MLIDQCFAQPSLEKPSPAADRNKYRVPQIDIRQRGILKLNRMSASNPSPRSSGNPVEEKAERVLEEPERMVDTKKTSS